MRLYKFSILITAFLFLISCGGDNDSSTFQYHPKKERIPYQDIEAPVELIKKTSVGENEKQSLLKGAKLKSIMNVSEAEPISEVMVNEFLIDVQSIDENRLIFLADQTNLYEYNILSKNWTKIAGEGRGPGDLMYATDLSMSGSNAYVSTEDYRIHIFDCSIAPCQYQSTIPLKGIRPYSIFADDEQITLMAPSSGVPDQKMMQDSLTILHTISANGEIETSFGEMYDVAGKWILTRNLNSGKIKQLRDSDFSFLQYYSFFPHLYLFNHQNSVDKIIRFDNFDQGFWKLNIHSMESFSPADEWTFIESVTVLDNSKLIVNLRHHLQPYAFDNRATDFYFIDLESSDHAFLGSAHAKDEKIWFTNQHLLRRNSDNEWLVSGFQLSAE